MEDAHFLDLGFAGKGWVFAGVYDGHGGKYAAQYACQMLHKLFLSALNKGLTPQQAFVNSYETVSDELNGQESGTTAVNFLIKEGIVYTANVGDARAIVVGTQGVRQLTADHRLGNFDERLRIEKMGGQIGYPYVRRGLLGIMPTRTLGDEYFKPVGVIATPSVDEYKIAPTDLMLIAACDGLFDFMSNEEVAGFARRFPDPAALVDALKDEVLVNRAGSDNLTIIAVSLQSETDGRRQRPSLLARVRRRKSPPASQHQ